MHLLPGFEFLKIKSVLYDTDNTPKNVTGVGVEFGPGVGVGVGFEPGLGFGFGFRTGLGIGVAAGFGFGGV